MKIVSPGYVTNANCQMSRSIRENGCYYTVRSRDVRLVEGRGTHFYHVSDAHITKHESIPENFGLTASASPPKDRRKRNRNDAKKGPEQIFFDEENEECVICMDNKREVVFVACGHYYCCRGCFEALTVKQCPLCKNTIAYALDRSDVKL